MKHTEMFCFFLWNDEQISVDINLKGTMELWFNYLNDDLKLLMLNCALVYCAKKF